MNVAMIEATEPLESFILSHRNKLLTEARAESKSAGRKHPFNKGLHFLPMRPWVASIIPMMMVPVLLQFSPWQLKAFKHEKEKQVHTDCFIQLRAAVTKQQIAYNRFDFICMVIICFTFLGY